MYSKKLIEVALPLGIINEMSAYDKMPGIGAHPKGIHHWWARLPLPAARAVLFASLVDDPSAHPEKFVGEAACVTERERLFGIIRRLCVKKVHKHQEVFREAHEEILKHCNGRLPTIMDPFAGGGSIPLEGMRLGLPVIASDLNPVAVLINKAMLELLPSVATHPPINPDSAQKLASWSWERAQGLAEDLRYYGRQINEATKEKIGHYYPKVKTADGKELTVITWLWARTVKCSNPTCGCTMPLVRSFILSSKSKTYAQPIISRDGGAPRITGYNIAIGSPELKGTVNRQGATCVACGESMKLDYLRAYGKKSGFGQQLMCVVASRQKVNGSRERGGKIYLPPDAEQERIANCMEQQQDVITGDMPNNPRWFSPPGYGLNSFQSVFSKRQLLALLTIQQEINECCTKLKLDGAAPEYVLALKTLLLFTIDRMADFNCTLSSWKPSGEQQMHLFTRQAIPMVWDFTEANILEPKGIAWILGVDITADSVETMLTTVSQQQMALQANATAVLFERKGLLISTDPPYYDNIGYADLSDFFYVWLRKLLQEDFPDLLRTKLVPKEEELIASEQRQGNKGAAKEHFESGFRTAFTAFRSSIDERFPLTVYYAFKQEEEQDDDIHDKEDDSINLTTGWETLLEGLISSGYQITATWPIKASQQWRMVAMGTNALTSYIVLACRPRPDAAPTSTRREYMQSLRRELGKALIELQTSNLAPVDLAQAAIGPGMAIYSRYGKIQEQDGSAMRVKTALALINRTLDELLAEQEGDFETETRWALAWYEEYGYAEGPFGDANQFAAAKGTAVNALVSAGIVKSGSGKVRLLRRDELPDDWDPTNDRHLIKWEVVQHLIKTLSQGTEKAARLYKALSSEAEAGRELAYRLFTISEKRGFIEDAIAYNSLVLEWNAIVSHSYAIKDAPKIIQASLEL